MKKIKNKNLVKMTLVKAETLQRERYYKFKFTPWGNAFPCWAHNKAAFVSGWVEL